MLKTLQIKNFRCFDDFEMTGLERVNLLVGTNNSGKTSILEALELWAARGHLGTLFAAMERRGEFLPPERTDWYARFAVRHLFHGHALEPGMSLFVIGHEESVERGVSITVEKDSQLDLDQSQTVLWEESQMRFGYGNEEEQEISSRVLDWRLVVIIRDMDESSHSGRRPTIIPLNASGATGNPRARAFRPEPSDGSVFVTTRSLSAAKVAEMFGEVVLTDEEALITSALKSLEPAIERVATLPMSGHPGERGGIVAKCAGQKERIPIGSMGDGIWRILALALALVNARGGILLVDEIDTGLHFTVMNSMWKLITQTAQRLDVQVFATSHSRDCYESLASVLRDEQTGGATVAIHRLEREKKRSVVFDEKEIVIAASRNIEVR